VSNAGNPSAVLPTLGSHLATAAHSGEQTTFFTNRSQFIPFASPIAFAPARLPFTVYDASMNPFQVLLEFSLANKRGLTFYVNGQAVVGYVTKIADHTVEVRNQQHDRVILLIDRIDGVAQ
jgi:hypothetical protein